MMAIGHEVRLTPPAYVKAYVKRGKTDAADHAVRGCEVEGAAGGVVAPQDPGDVTP